MKTTDLDIQDKLAEIKARALLHDPPHKSWCISKMAKIGNCNYEEEAYRFRNILLTGTVLETVSQDDADNRVKNADVVSWGLYGLLMTSVFRQNNCVIGLDVLVNVFDPSLQVSLEDPSFDVLSERVEGLARKINEVLSHLNQCRDLGLRYSLKMIAYTVLYVLLEPLHYIKGIPVSLADTRVPTHTLYDHLYAKASMSNLFLEKDGEPRGYLVLVDVPGIQEFVTAARKAGDYWAGSWLLSRVIWNLAEELMRELGPDVLITPATRFNPAFYDYVLRYLRQLEEKAAIYSRDCAKSVAFISNQVEESIRELMARLVDENQTGLSLDELAGQVLTPAVIQIVLPRIKVGSLDFTSKENVVKTLSELYESSWEKIVKSFKQYLGKLCGVEKGDFCLAYRLLDLIDEIVQKPNMGARITVVDFNQVFNDLKDCIEGKDEACSRINASTEALRSIASSFKKLNSGDLARIVLFHEAVQQVAKTPDTIPLPRSFWKFDEDNQRLTPLVKNYGGFKEQEEGSEDEHFDWMPCSQCGVEPAVIRIRKEVSGQEENYRKDDIEDLMKILDRARVSREICKCDSHSTCDCEKEMGLALSRIGLRPGEALGPYCLLKRLIYYVARSFRQDRGPNNELVNLRKEVGLPNRKIMSTDDVALIPLLQTVNILTGKHDDTASYEDVVEVFAQYICKEARNKGFNANEVSCRIAASYLTVRGKMDIELAAKELGVSLDVLRKIVENAIRDLFHDTIERGKSGASEYTLKVLERKLSLGGREDDILLRVIREVQQGSNKRSELLVSRLANVTTSYLIIKADADNIGLLHNGRLYDIDGRTDCKKYMEALLHTLERSACVKCNEALDAEHEHILGIIREEIGNICRIVENLYKTTILVSPGYKSALSTSLMISSVKDLHTVEKSGGVLVFSGGDDLLAIMPPLPVWKPLIFRNNYRGQKGFHWLRKDPIAPAIPFGRSISVRISELMDIMSQEIWKTIELLEEVGKETVWMYEGREWEKDSLVMSGSRVGTVITLPLSLMTREGKREVISDNVLELIKNTHALILAGVLSPNLPEDLENSYGIKEAESLLTRRPRELINLITYVLGRNINLPSNIEDYISKNSIVNLLLGSNLKVGSISFTEVLGNITFSMKRPGSSRSSPLLEYARLYRILRVIP